MNPGHTILDVMADAPAGAAFRELAIAEATQLGRATVHAWLGKLRDLDLVRWKGDRSRTGWVLTELGIDFHAALQRAGRIAA